MKPHPLFKTTSRFLSFRSALPLIILFLMTGPGYSYQENSSRPLTTKIGVRISDLYDFNLPAGTYNALFRVWHIHTDPDYHPDKTTEVLHSQSVSVERSSRSRAGNLLLSRAKYRAKIVTRWNLAHFPFDKQTLRISLEDASSQWDHIHIIPDIKNSGVSDKALPSDWELKDFQVKAVAAECDSQYGGFTSDRRCSNFVATAVIQRRGLKLYFEIFTGTFIAFLAAILTFFVPADDLAAKLRLALAAVFAAIGNKYIIDAMLPTTSSISLRDKVQVSTFLVIGLALVTSIISARLNEAGKIELTKKLNRYATYTVIPIYCLLNLIWALSAAF